MNIQQIIYVVEVYKLHSFSLTAHSLFVSQPRLSQAIRDLERELGFDIFERNRKGISGTTVRGYEFIIQARNVLKQFSSLENFKESPVSSFHLATTLVSQAQNAFVNLCSQNAQNPHLNFDMFFCGCYEAVDRVKNFGYDLGIVTIIDPQLSDWMSYFKSSKLDFHDLLCSKYQITVHQNSDLAARSSIKPEDLEGYTYITEKCSRMNSLTLQVYSLLDKICPEARITVSNTDIMYQFVSDNRAFTLDCMPLDEKTCRKYSLVSRPLDENLRVHFGYIVPANMPLSQLSITYLELLKKELLLHR